MRWLYWGQREFSFLDLSKDSGILGGSVVCDEGGTRIRDTENLFGIVCVKHSTRGGTRRGKRVKVLLVASRKAFTRAWYKADLPTREQWLSILELLELIQKGWGRLMTARQDRIVALWLNEMTYKMLMEVFICLFFSFFIYYCIQMKEKH